MLLGGKYDERLLRLSKFPSTLFRGRAINWSSERKGRRWRWFSYAPNCSYLDMEPANAVYFEDDLDLV